MRTDINFIYIEIYLKIITLYILLYIFQKLYSFGC